MHTVIMLSIIATAVCLRCQYRKKLENWQKRWEYTLFAFLFSPLLVITTAISIVCMGRQEQMLGLPAEGLSYSLTLIFLAYATIRVLVLIRQGQQLCHKLLLTCPQILLSTPSLTQSGRLLNSPQPFAARVGFWHTELAISQGMLDLLNPEHLEAVLKHEQAHEHYHDTFWFFWLGYIRQITAWLPKSEALWQELLLLRELRADRWAAKYVDKLVLAESLLWSVSSAAVVELDVPCAAFGQFTYHSYLEERIDALISNSESEHTNNYITCFWMLLTLTPLLLINFHC